MLLRLVFGVSLLGLVAACETLPVDGSAASSSVGVAPSTPKARTFAAVTARIEPVAERECRARTSGVNCDFHIVVDDRPNQPSNAYQFLDKNDRPIIAFTTALIREARNADEIAFVMGHEAAHHIEGHIARQHDNAIAGAVIFAGLATLSGATAAGVDEATQLGAQVGARSFSKDFELEADELGTVITHRAGYSPLLGAEFFSRIPDPGDRFLGTHPPNAARVQKVIDTVEKLK
jgi:Zn-dependent protease with chaperone function